MRRAHTVRNHTNGRPSLQLGTDDLGALTEGDERSEEGLRKKLLDKDRENDKVCIFWVSPRFLLWSLGVVELCRVVAHADPDAAGSALPATFCGSRPGVAEGV